jgi:hypothetical protein
MKQYVIDELRPADFTKLKTYLDGHYAVDGFEGLYHIDLTDALLTETQKTHCDCGPYYFALELLPGRLVCELLVRARQRISCHCIQYATPPQRNWLIQTVDAVFDALGVVS